MSDLSLRNTIQSVKERHAQTEGILGRGDSLDEYIDLDAMQLPERAAVQLAAETGEPVRDFEAAEPIPDFEDQEVEFDGE